ncbi:hypothetical protein JCM10213_001901 [Rhodosporidiobolus nylandii]
MTLTATFAVSAAPERRRVLTHSTSSSFNTSSAAAAKPIRAKVNLSATAGPSSPSWQPGDPVRARVRVQQSGGGAGGRSGGGSASAPSTPATSSAPFARGGTPASTATGGVRATLSPKLPSSSRAPSPVRARSPDAGGVRSTPVAKSGPRVVGAQKYGTPEPSLLRGQSDPFPSTPSTAGSATPISHLPSSVSVRRIHSPTLRASPSLGVSSGSSSIETPSYLPPLSTSPGSAASSPLTSPSFKGYVSDYPSSSLSLSAASAPGFDGSVGKRAGAGVRRTSGVSSVSSVSASEVRITNGPLLPPIAISSEIASPQSANSSIAFPPYSPPLRSPPLQPIPIRATPTPGTVRSPTLPSLPSSRSITTAASSATPPSRPPLSASNPANRRRHVRSNSATSTSSRSSALSTHDDHPPHEQAVSWSRARVPPVTITGGSTRSRPASPTTSQIQTNGRPALNAVDWTSFSALEAEAAAHSPSLNGGGRVSSGSEVSGLSAESRLAPNSPKKEIDEKEREARVERKILDLEITNSSLLSINASLERLKLKQSSEIRELRRRLRESVGGAGLAALRARAAALDEGVSGGESSDPDDEEDEDGEETPEPTWQELLDGDEHFSAVAATLESLVRRAKGALEYVPAAHEGGRVLSTVEQEDRLEVETVDAQVQTDPPPLAPAGRAAPRGLGIAGWKGR